MSIASIVIISVIGGFLLLLISVYLFMKWKADSFVKKQKEQEKLKQQDLNYLKNEDDHGKN